MESEEWKEIPGYEGYYEVSKCGKVRSVERVIEMKNGCRRKFPGVLMTQQVHMKGYLILWLRRNGDREKVYVHRVVASAYHPNTENKICVNHKDKDRQNNHYENLEWCTIGENNEHRDTHTHNDEPF